MAKSSKSNVPVEVRTKIAAIRKQLRLSQAQIAKKLRVDQSAVSSWERGLYEPSPESYLLLGNEVLADEDRIWCWGRAGLDIRRMVDTAVFLLARQPSQARPRGSVQILPLPGTTERIEPIDLWLPAPLIQNPLATFYVRIPDDFSAPRLKRGDMFVIDSTATDLGKIEDGSFVAVAVPKGDPGKSWQHEEPFPLHVGRTLAQDMGHGRRDYYLFVEAWEQADRALYLGFSIKDNPPLMHVEGAKVLGRVIAWASPERRHARKSKK